MIRLSYFRLFLLTVLGIALAMPVVLWGAWRGSLTMRNLPILWIPADNPQRVEYEWFRDNFQVRDAAIVTWEGCTLGDPRLSRFAEALRSEKRLPSGTPYTELFSPVVTGTEMLREFVGPPLELSRAEAIDRLQGVLVGPDGATTCAVVTFTEQGMAEKEAAVAALRHEAIETAGVPPAALHLAGTPVDSVAIDAASARSMNRFLLPSAVLVLLLCRLCLRSWRFTFAVILVATFGEIFVLALVFFAGATMNAVLTVMAPLMFVLAVSSGVHLVNYFRDEVRLRGRGGAAHRALAAGWIPCTLASVTTAIGMGSLAVSEMVPVQHFGVISAIGVLVVTALLFMLLPGLMEKWPKGEKQPKSDLPLEEGVPPRSWHRLAVAVRQGATPIVVAMLLAMAGLGWGLTKLRTSVNVLDLLTPGSRVVQDYRWIETHLAPVVPIEIVVQFPADEQGDLLARVEQLREVEHALEEIELLGGSLSAASFVPVAPEESGVGATIRRSVQRSRIRGQLDQFAAANYLYQGDDWQSWRVSTRVPATRDLNYATLMQAIRDRVDPVLEGYEHATGVPTQAIYTGITPLVNVAQQTLLHDLINSFLTALVLVAIVMMLVLRSVSAGLVAMLPNLLPTLLLFGMMGWVGQPVDIGSMMTASVALGIAIDGTLHYLNWFRREVGRGRPAEAAVALTYHHCGNAMWQTATICGLGLLVFAFSAFVPTQRFAWMMLLLLMLALLGDLVLLPALLVGPFRRLFEPRTVPQAGTEIGDRGKAVGSKL